MRLFGSEKLMDIFNAIGVPEGEEIQHKMLTNAIEKAQKKIEGNNFNTRKSLLEYDRVNNDQREVIYAERETAERFAIRFGSEGIFDYFKLSDEYAIYEVSVPEMLIGKTLVERNVRQKYNINVLAIKTDDRFNAMITPDHRFSEDEKLLVLGTKESVKKLLK